MGFNINSGYGSLQAMLIHQLGRPVMGKIFMVCATSNTLYTRLESLFRDDPDGTKRLFTSINDAMDECTAANDDVILVAPGHTEAITAATSAVIDVAGVTVLGLGQGNNRPVLDFTNTAGSIEMDAANTRLSNCILRANVSAVVVGINVDAAGVEIDRCRFEYNATGDDFITMIDVDGVNDAYIHDNEMIAEDTAGCDEAIRLDDCDNVRIIKNHIYGDFTDGAIIGEGAAGANLVIRDNTIYNSDTTAGFVVDLNVAFTGLLAYNILGTLFATAPETALDPGSLLSVENYVCNAVDESGALVPTTVST